MIGFIIIILAFVIHGVAKAIGDYIDFTNLDAIKRDRPVWFYVWVLGDPMNQNAGNPLQCDLWHFCMGHVVQWTLCLGIIGGSLYGFSWWLVPICWAGYWLEGRVFTLIFHVYLMRDWELSYWVKDTFML